MDSHAVYRGCVRASLSRTSTPPDTMPRTAPPLTLPTDVVASSEHAVDTAETLGLSQMPVTTSSTSIVEWMRSAANRSPPRGTQDEIAKYFCGAFKVQSEYVSQFVDDIDSFAVSSKSYRIAYGLDAGAGYSLIVVTYMPSPAHETAIRALSYALMNGLDGDVMRQDPMPERVIWQGGASTHRSEDGKSGKEPDDCFRHCFNSHLVTTVVMEVGMSETPTKLGLDSHIWIENFPNVQLVILVSVFAAGSNDAADTHPDIIITQLVPGNLEHDHKLRKGTGARVKTPKQLGTPWLAKASRAPGEFSVPVANFFVGEVIPAALTHLHAGPMLTISRAQMQDVCNRISAEWLEWKARL